jgi:hypothetical protein
MSEWVEYLTRSGTSPMVELRRRTVVRSRGGCPSGGSCNNEWATVSLDKVYKLTLVTDGMYNLEVKEEGPLTTLPGKSPGACESGTDNGHTVAAGITGRTHQDFNATVKSAVAPNRHPDCGVSGCAGSGDFLDAVFGAGVGNYTRDAWSWTTHYQTGSNGTYFDTSVAGRSTTGATSPGICPTHGMVITRISPNVTDRYMQPWISSQGCCAPGQGSHRGVCVRDGSLTSRTDGECLGGPGPSGGRGWASMGTTSRQEGQRHQQHRRSAGCA